MPVMSVIPVLLGQWLLPAVLPCWGARAATWLWLPCGSREDLKKAVGSLSVPSHRSQAVPRSCLPCPCSQQPVLHLPSREFAEGLFPVSLLRLYVLTMKQAAVFANAEPASGSLESIESSNNVFVFKRWK